MALTSSSTISDAEAQLTNSLGWEGSATKAADALEAVRFLLANRVESGSIGGASYSRPSLMDLEKRLASYVAATSSTARASRAPFTRGRAL